MLAAFPCLLLLLFVTGEVCTSPQKKKTNKKQKKKGKKVFKKVVKCKLLCSSLAWHSLLICGKPYLTSLVTGR